MESEPASAPILPASGSKPQSHAKLITIAVVAAIAVVAGAFLVSAFLKPQGTNAWLFKGAYATYEGSTSVYFVTINFTVRQEVLDFNSTHAKISTYFKMGSSFGETVENETAAWVPLSQVGFTTAFEGSNLTRSYETNLDIAGFGTRQCVVYEYATDGPTMTVYVDKQIGWPLKMTASMSGDYPMSLDINLKETNIPGLK